MREKAICFKYLVLNFTYVHGEGKVLPVSVQPS